MNRSLLAVIGGALWLGTTQAQSVGEGAIPLPFVGGSTTLAVLPDTQYYSLRYHQHFEAQTRWIAESFRERNIAYTLHLGDIVQNDAPKEWEVAKRCMGMLDGKVPYLLIPGNHDYSDNSRRTRLSEYFPVEDFKKWPSYGGVLQEGELDNNYHLFRIFDQDWIALGLEFGPREKAMAWANEVLAEHRDRRAIIVTHGYLFYDNQRYDHRQGKQRATPYGYAGDGADGEQLWNAVARRNPNVMIVICGHVRTGGLGYRKSEGDYGNTVHEMMANYQKLPAGGLGYMRLLEFQPDRKTVQVRTFSPSLKKLRHSELEDFSFVLQNATRAEPKRVPADAAPLRVAPVHRYSFDGEGGDGTKVKDLSGDLDGALKSPDGSARLDGEGHLVIDRSDGGGLVELSPELLKGKRRTSMEIWLTPTAEAYKWHAVTYFGDRDDAFYYTFRTLTKHRAELIDDGHNEDIQRDVAVKVGEPMHIVMTYDQGGGKKPAVITSFIDGEMNGSMNTSIQLSDLDLKHARIGPFAGVYDELRIYDYALSPHEVRNNFRQGPDVVDLAGDDR